jgi:hypothetical protein|tara:strand:+ start:263 stop:472 length:210 start_codon:yes stop_codon:yes gene_type:complete
MTIQKSPFPYIIILSIIISSALCSRLTIDKSINQPIVYSIEREIVSEPVIIVSETTSINTANPLILTIK